MGIATNDLVVRHIPSGKGLPSMVLSARWKQRERRLFAVIFRILLPRRDDPAKIRNNRLTKHPHSTITQLRCTCDLVACDCKSLGVGICPDLIDLSVFSGAPWL